jgi:hypothetical protein
MTVRTLEDAMLPRSSSTAAVSVAATMACTMSLYPRTAAAFSAVSFSVVLLVAKCSIVVVILRACTASNSGGILGEVPAGDMAA